MRPEVLSQADRISRGDEDLRQNILSFNCQNNYNALSRGKNLSIGEQVNFMKMRASELRSGKRYDFGHNRYKGSDDVYNLQRFYNGDVRVLRIHYSDESGNDEFPENGIGELTFETSNKNAEQQYLFNVDIEAFLKTLNRCERIIFTKFVSGYSYNYISDIVKLSPYEVSDNMRMIGLEFAKWFEITNIERFGLTV